MDADGCAGPRAIAWSRMNAPFDEDPHAWVRLRQRMVAEQLVARGIRDERVLEAMRGVERHEFVPAEVRREAYEDRALPIAHGQTISQPYIVAFMTEQLRAEPNHRVLEIGTGSGYQAAVLSRLVREVISVERIDALRAQAQVNLDRLGAANVRLLGGDGSLGCPSLAPFDRIIVTAGAPRLPPSLIEQLVEGGLLIAPVGGWVDQQVVRVQRTPAGLIQAELLPCRFVKLIGQEGWGADS